MLGAIVRPRILEDEETFWRSLKPVLPNSASFLKPPAALYYAAYAHRQEQNSSRNYHTDGQAKIWVLMTLLYVTNIPDTVIHSHLR